MLIQEFMKAAPAKKKKKEKLKKKRRERNKKIMAFQKQISENSGSIWSPELNAMYHKQNSNSWFDISITKSKIKNEFNHKYDDEFFSKPKKIFSSKKVIMLLNHDQKQIINRWLDASGLMYNETLKLIKTRKANKQQTILNYKNLRSNFLKETRDDIKRDSSKINKERVKTHILDGAIKLACANYKSALTSFRKKIIRHFRIRYWRHNRTRKVMEIEPQYFKKNKLCSKIFGEIKYKYNGKDYELGKIKSACTLLFDKEFNQYCLLIPSGAEIEKNKNENKIGVMDPGIRDFMTLISENEAAKIGSGCGKRIQKYLELQDKFEKRDLPNKIKRKHVERISKKITCLVDELHWKVIRFLIKRYQIILIGNMSVKGITNNQTSKLTDMTKRVGYRLKFYQFRKRLEYKCALSEIKYQSVDESYTSKICSNCGNYHKNLGSNKIYKCTSCGIKIDRDMNGSRGITIKSM